MKVLNACSSDNVPRVLVGNKSDLKIERQVKHEEAIRLAEDWGCAYVECSAKHNDNIGMFSTCHLFAHPFPQH